MGAQVYVYVKNVDMRCLCLKEEENEDGYVLVGLGLRIFVLRLVLVMVKSRCFRLMFLNHDCCKGKGVCFSKWRLRGAVEKVASQEHR